MVDIYNSILVPNWDRIIPTIFALITFYIQWKKDAGIIIIALYAFEVLSITTGSEYILISTITDSPIAVHNVFDRVMLAIAAIIMFLTIFNHISRGTWIGDQTNRALNKFLGTKHKPITYSLINQLDNIRSAKDSIKIEDKNQISDARDIFIENATYIMVRLDQSPYYTQIQNIYNLCEQNFDDLCNSQQITDEQINKIRGSISKFIGIGTAIEKTD